MFDALFRFLKQACRAHARHLGFSLLVIFTMALGLAASTSVFSVVYALLLRPLPFTDSDRLLMLASSQPHRDAHRLAVSYPDFKDWRTSTDVFSEMALVSNSRALTLSGEGQPEHLTVELVSGNYFSMLGLDAVVGRVFTPEDDVNAGGHPLALLSYNLWVRRFEQDPKVVGTQILLSDRSYTVVGVLDPVYRGTWWDPVDLWVPTAMVTEVIGENYLTDRATRWGSVMARLQPGVTAEQARDFMNRVAEGIEKENPVSNQGYRIAQYPLNALYYDYSKEPLKQALWGGVLLLLLCCVNVAGLMLTRGTLRRQEVAVRSALGAGRNRLLAEELGQSLMLALAGGALGVFLAAVSTRWLVGMSTLSTMNTEQKFMEPMVFIVALGLTLLAGLVFGIAPALQALRAEPQRHLNRGAGRASAGRGFRWLLDGLGMGELALAVVLLVSAAGGIQSFLDLRDAKVGYSTKDLLTLRLDLSSSRLKTSEAQGRFALELVQEVNALAGVKGSALVGPYAPPDVVLYTDLTIEDRLADSTEDAALRSYRQYISPGYLGVTDIALLEGREFTADDDAEAPLVAIVGKALAERAWPSDNPLGKRLRRGLPDAENPWMTVVGVAETVKNRGAKNFARGPEYDIYMPFLQEPTAVPTLMVRSMDSAEASFLADPVRRTVQRLDPDVPVYQVMTMKDQIVGRAQDEYFLGILLLLFAAFATVVAGVGIFGILSYSVRSRRQELGVRMALGGSTGSVLALVAKRGLMVLGLGMATGFAMVWVFQKSLPGGGFDLGSANVLILLSTLGFLVVVALVAIFLPAVRATRIPPTIALRSE